MGNYSKTNNYLRNFTYCLINKTVNYSAGGCVMLVENPTVWDVEPPLETQKVGGHMAGSAVEYVTLV